MGNLTIGISEHLPSFMIVRQTDQTNLPKKHNTYKRDVKNFDRENFILDMLSIDWKETLKINNNNVNVSFDNIIDKINLLVDKYIPLKKVRNREFKMKFNPWINHKIIEDITNKNKLFNKYLKCKNKTTKSLLYNEYKKLKNEILAQTRESKREFCKDYFTKNNNNLKKIWQGIKQIINVDSKNFEQPSCLVTKDKNIITDQIEIASTFIDYFYISSRKHFK